MKSLIIGLSGKQGAGKNYYGLRLYRVLTEAGVWANQYAIANTLKEFAIECKKDQALGTIYAEEFFGICTTVEKRLNLISICKDISDLMHEAGNKKPRKAYQQCNRLKEIYGDDVFVKGLENKIRSIENEHELGYYREGDDYPIVHIVTDVRYADEIDWIYNNRGKVYFLNVKDERRIMRIKKRDGYYDPESANHSSEKCMDKNKHLCMQMPFEQIEGAEGDIVLWRMLSNIFDILDKRL